MRTLSEGLTQGTALPRSSHTLAPSSMSLPVTNGRAPSWIATKGESHSASALRTDAVRVSPPSQKTTGS